MNYYYFDTSAYPDITTEIMQPDPKVWDEEHYQSNMSYWEHPDFEPIFGQLLLKVTGKKATKRPTDFLAAAGLYGGLGYVMSGKAKSVIEKFKLPEHRFYALPAYTLEATGETFHYYYLHILVADDNYDFIDFPASTFERTDFLGENGQPIAIGSAEEWKDIRKNMDELEENIREVDLVLSDLFHKLDPDLFRIQHFLNSEFIMSERLKNALEENDISGLSDFYEYEPRINGNDFKDIPEKPVETVAEKEPFQPKSHEEVTQKLDFIFAEMDVEEDAIYDYDQEIDAALEFLSRTDDPIKPIFAYFEKHPEAIHGAPGPFVHYLETYFGIGLEAELIASINRNPTIEAINMIYRLANDESNPDREKYIAILKETAKSEDEYIAQSAQDCIDDL
ncbi:hypothetical protein [Flavobacterium sp.]|uniref:hypothetical protein n=1 Tax=Flavobacterium sp. TaxID=239 RepID=UPI0025C59944|nr:hypothetical protein [Flavobacterium sp.]